MELIKEILNELSSLPHRGFTTGNERRGAEIIEKCLQEIGYSTRIDSFQSPATYSWEVMLFVTVVAVGFFMAPEEPYLAGILCAVGL